MARTRKNTPLRFFKRNALYFALIAVLLALVAAVVLVAFQIVRIVELNRQEQALQAQIRQEEVQPSEQTQEETTAPEEPVEEAEPSLSNLPGAFVPPFDGATKFLANQKLALTYDDTALVLEESDGRYSLKPVDGTALPRLELQSLPTSLDALSDAELEGLSVGLLQAYYYVAPKTEDIVCTDTQKTENEYCVTLDAPAHADAPVMQAKVRLMQVQDQFWYAIALLPAETDGTAVEQAIDNLTIR